MMMSSMCGSLRPVVHSRSPGIPLVRTLAEVLRSLSSLRKTNWSTLRSVVSRI
uniref:Uncharacterized protein n=1 Tax=Populus trichocarpa TaxID=3694 RepID=A9PEW9_POPTR|nr:unknown [Populus trichocarpa]